MISKAFLVLIMLFAYLFLATWQMGSEVVDTYHDYHAIVERLNEDSAIRIQTGKEHSYPKCNTEKDAIYSNPVSSQPAPTDNDRPLDLSFKTKTIDPTLILSQPAPT